jgi:hypothetical protein
MNTLTAIVPRLAPVIDGVGDYALSLAREVRERYGVNTSFLVGDAMWFGEGKVEEFPVSKLTERKAVALSDALSRDGESTVLLHYGGYAYAQRGCPNWLVEALTKWRLELEGRRLITIFHELYASGPPWTSSFWLSRRQRGLTEQLARLSDSSLTSLAFYSELLAAAGGRAESLPVFSSIGEPNENPKPLSVRRRRLVVFGTPGRRLQVYRRSADALNHVCRELGIEEVWDIGGNMHWKSPRLDVPIRFGGKLSAPDVTEAMLDSIAGVIDYPADMLGKSTIFAAYCAHKMLPLVAGYGGADPADGLEPGVHYKLLDSGDELNLSNAQRVADNASVWYQGHTLNAHARLLATTLQSDPSLPTREVFAHA